MREADLTGARFQGGSLRDTDLSGAVYTISVENRGAETVDVDLAVEGPLGHRQLRVRSPR